MENEKTLDLIYANYFNLYMTQHTSLYSIGFTAITNDVLTCNRLSPAEKIVLQEILHHYAIQKKRAVKIKKWILENATTLSKRSLRDILNSLKRKEFIIEFEVEGGDIGTYTLHMSPHPHFNAHVILSEMEKAFLKEQLNSDDTRFTTKKDITTVLNVVEQIKKENLDKDLITRLSVSYKKMDSTLQDLIELENYNTKPVLLDSNRLLKQTPEDVFFNELNEVYRDFRKLVLCKTHEKLLH